jgi:hypothetical protein
MESKFRTGDRVSMASHWLKSTQAHCMGNLKGTVYYVGDRVVSVEWDNGHISGVLSSNLVRVDRMHVELF